MQAIFSFFGYLILTFLLLGVLIFVHELGHYLSARLCHVTINEFAIGMGKRLWGFKSKKTGIEYSLRLFPIGGYVAMAGEDEEVDDPNAFNKKNVWQRIFILVSGAAMNILTGFIAMTVLVVGMLMAGYRMPSNEIKEFALLAPSQVSGLEVGDEIVKVDGVNIHTGYDLAYEIMNSGYEAVDVVVRRDGKLMVVRDVIFPVSVEGNTAFGNMDFNTTDMEVNFGNIAKTVYFRSTSTVKMVFDSIGGMIFGRYSVTDMSGPIGVSTAVSEVAVGDLAGWNLLYLFSILAMNLGVVNLLPLPALDGGRVFFRLIEILRFGRPVNPKVEASVHGAGLTILLLFSVFIAFKDIFVLF